MAGAGGGGQDHARGRVYEIVGDYGPDDAVPPTAIRGGWKVDDASRIVGDFLPNPNFPQPG